MAENDENKMSKVSNPIFKASALNAYKTSVKQGLIHKVIDLPWNQKVLIKTDITDKTKVVVTFINSGNMNNSFKTTINELPSYGIDLSANV